MGRKRVSAPPPVSPTSTLIDSHCHIVFRNFEDDLEDVATRWREAGVGALLHACVEPAEIPAIRSLADRFPEMRYSVGVHPLDTKHWCPDTVDVLRQAALDDPRVVAIGELGLDLFRDKNLDEQLAVLRPQLDLAVELNLPVIVHCRDAAEPMLEELRARRSEGLCPAGVMHCWGGTPEEMHAFLDLGFYISFSGTVTFPKAFATHACAEQVPEDRFWSKPIVLFWLQYQDEARGTNRLLWHQWPLALPICAVLTWIGSLL